MGQKLSHTSNQEPQEQAWQKEGRGKIERKTKEKKTDKDLVTQLKEAAELINTVQSINQEVSENTVTIRKLGSDKQETMKREELIKNMLASNKLPLN